MTRYSSPPIRGLTLHRPWTWAITELDKRLENRDWPPPAWVLERPAFYLAIHAGRTYDSRSAEWIGETFGRWPPGTEECPQGIVAVARLGAVVARSDSPWFVGPWGWQLEDLVTLREPIPCRGQQGLWPLGQALLSQVRGAWRAAKGGA